MLSFFHKFIKSFEYDSSFKSKFTQISNYASYYVIGLTNVVDAGQNRGYNAENKADKETDRIRF